MFSASWIVLFLVVFRTSVYSQSERCGHGSCVSPRRCSSGYYYQRLWMGGTFSFCCFTDNNEYIKTDSSPDERLKLLDCRLRNVSNLARTEADQDVRLLDLSFNKLLGKAEYIRDDFLQHFPRLRGLTISSSSLDTVPSNFLWENGDLEHLVMTWNSLKVLPEDLLSHCPSLVKVDFSSNEIEILPSNLFEHTPHIVEIQMKNNKLRYLKSENFRHVKLLKYLDVSDNLNLQCISYTFLKNTHHVIYVGLKNTGVRLPRTLQHVFCNNDRTCKNTMSTLDWQLLLYGGLRWRSRNDLCDEESGRYGDH